MTYGECVDLSIKRPTLGTRMVKHKTQACGAAMAAEEGGEDNDCADDDDDYYYYYYEAQC